MVKPCFLLTQLPSKCNRAIHALITVFLSYAKKLLLKLQMLIGSGRGIFGVTFLPTIVSLIKQTGVLWIFISVGVFRGRTVVLGGSSVGQGLT